MQQSSVGWAALFATQQMMYQWVGLTITLLTQPTLLIMSKLQDIPVEGQKIEFNQFDIVVKKMNGPRTLLVQAYPNKISDL